MRRRLRANLKGGTRSAKAHLSELLEKVEAGAEMTITRHGAPVARLVPVKKGSQSGGAHRSHRADREACQRPIPAGVKG